MKAAALLPLLAGLVLAACTSTSEAPAPRPVATARPAPATGPIAASPSATLGPAAPRAGWADAPATPGTWRHAAADGRSEAIFLSPAGAALARLRCLAEARMIVLLLPPRGAAQPLVTLRTETMTRSLAASSADRALSLTFAPDDPLLDAMAFSRGRFAVEVEGAAPLSLPSWAEVSRVIEDCR